MKTQKRTFVVEHKFARRRSIAPPKSIWGDTDFKALTRQVNEDAEGLFAPPVVETAQGPLEALPLQRSERPPAIRQTATLAVIKTDTEKSSSRSIDEKKLIAEPESTTSADRSISAPASKAKGKRNRQRLPRAELASSNGTEIAISDHSDSYDLEALTRENLALKKRLREHLRMENDRLQTLLQRFL